MKCYKIAGHTLALIGEAEEAMIDKLWGFGVFLTSNEPDWEVRIVDEVELPSYKPNNTFDFENGAMHCGVGYQNGCYIYEMTPAAGCKVPPMKMRYDGGREVLMSHVNDISVLRFSLWMAFTLLGMHHMVMPIHSSVIVRNGKAVLFLGESGTGKSTHTRLWLENIDGAHLLNDDSPILAIEDGKVFAYGSPWSGKTDCYKDECFEVAGFVRLSQAPFNRITRQPVLTAISALQPSLPPAIAYCEDGQDCQMQMISEILSGVPVYRMECLPDAAAARMSCGTIFGD